jgi:hypothetical protein
MDLTQYNFPVNKNPFWQPNTPHDLLEEAKERGFLYGRTPYNDLFSEIFFSGGQLNFKPDLPEDFKNKCFTYMRCLMKSFAPKHEHKEAVCAMLLSELVTLEPERAAK